MPLTSFLAGYGDERYSTTGKKIMSERCINSWLGPPKSGLLMNPIFAHWLPRFPIVGRWQASAECPP